MVQKPTEVVKNAQKYIIRIKKLEKEERFAADLINQLLLVTVQEKTKSY
jgi:hypothetical protein